MPNATVRANARTLPEEDSSPHKQRRAHRFEDAHRALEIPIYDLTRLLHAALTFKRKATRTCAARQG
jgi:hypothetical protein